MTIRDEGEAEEEQLGIRTSIFWGDRPIFLLRKLKDCEEAGLLSVRSYGFIKRGNLEFTQTFM